ncbi:MAG: hypothetical protein LBN41_10060, partial [Enterobacteriaceae bacterium]|nr:hypothetical protein [Enterobacteriaceae bacterium]
TSQRLYRPAFEQRIRLREQELKNSYTVDPIDSPFLKQVYRIDENTVIFDRNESASIAGFGRILEGHLYNNGVAFIVTSEIRDVSDPKYQKDREEYINSGTKESDLNDKPQKLAEIQNLLSRLNGRKDDEVPTQPGSCIPEGFIRDGNIKAKEDVALLYRQGDFVFAISSENASEESESLLERENEINAVIISSGAHTLKKGSVALSGITAEEWLMKARQGIYQPEDKMVPYYLFSFYINEKSADFEHPLLSVELHNSGLETKNYTDSQLVEIWDRITRTFRYRSNAF